MTKATVTNRLPAGHNPALAVELEAREQHHFYVDTNVFNDVPDITLWEGLHLVVNNIFWLSPHHCPLVCLLCD